MFRIDGIITDITPGKDGYSLILKDKNGESYFVIMSRIRLQEKYSQFNSGDRITVSGDTLHIGPHTHVLASMRQNNR